MESRACPYHVKVLAMTPNATTTNMDPMERFLVEGPAEQGILFIRMDTGELSIAKGCTCGNDVRTTGEDK
jgi:hypothetical protein